MSALESLPRKHYFLSYETNSTVIKQGRGALSVEERCQAQECLALREIHADILGHDTLRNRMLLNNCYFITSRLGYSANKIFCLVCGY